MLMKFSWISIREIGHYSVYFWPLYIFEFARICWLYNSVFAFHRGAQNKIQWYTISVRSWGKWYNMQRMCTEYCYCKWHVHCHMLLLSSPWQQFTLFTNAPLWTMSQRHFGWMLHLEVIGLQICANGWNLYDILWPFLYIHTIIDIWAIHRCLAVRLANATS